MQPDDAHRSLETELLRGPFKVPAGYQSLVAPIARASTITFDSADDFAGRSSRFPDGYSYGLTGTPTHFELTARLAVLEGANHVALAPSGQGAINLVNQSVLGAGDHVLISDSVYGPARANAKELLARFGVDVSFYDPLIGAGIETLLRPSTRLVWCESPGSQTLEVQDIPAIVRACKRHEVLVALDNTWSTPLGFRAVAHGIDFSVQALTKFVGGHSDFLLGSIAMQDRGLYGKLRRVANLLGSNVGADDCALALRGLATMPIRFRQQSATALVLAQWLSGHPSISWVGFPPLAGDPGNALYQRDFVGGGTVISLALSCCRWDQVCRVVDALQIFRIGASFGGVHSLIAAYPAASERSFPRDRSMGHLVRLSIGLETLEDLQDDLDRALARLQPD